VKLFALEQEEKKIVTSQEALKRKYLPYHILYKHKCWRPHDANIFVNHTQIQTHTYIFAKIYIRKCKATCCRF